MKKLVALGLSVLLVLSLIVSCGSDDAAAASEEVSISLWTQEGESEGVYQWIVDRAEEYMAANPLVTLEVVQKDTEQLREDYIAASFSGELPEFLWTVNDHAGVFTVANLLQPVDSLYDSSKFVESVMFDGKTYGVPIQSGNHLMLLYNKSLISEAPANTDEFIEQAQALTDIAAGQYGFAYNQTEPFWLVPWLGGFGGKVFAADGITPTLDTQAMQDTLQFLLDLKTTYAVMPSESDYAATEGLFLEGKAAMIVNGDWSLGAYADALGEDLGIARLPQVTATGEYPKPYTAGKYFMVSNGVEGAELAAVEGFIDYITSPEIQLKLSNEFRRLPALLSVYSDASIANDPILKGSSEQLAEGTPQPSVAEMRAVWDSMKPEMNAVLAGSKSPAEASAAMQAAAVQIISNMNE
jgi:arabinogalactan oligomer/maltooligosaccharide transport system substrate-binding protein